MKFAEVAVNSPIARRSTFCYSIPPHLSLDIGSAVLVPFGTRMLQGIVISLSDVPSIDVTKDIAGLISSSPLLSKVQVKIALWLSEYYLAPLFSAVTLMLPPGFERKLVSMVQILPDVLDSLDISIEQQQLLHEFEQKTIVRLGEIEKKLGKKKSGMIVNQLVQLGVLVKKEQMQGVKVKPRLVSYLKLEVSKPDIESLIGKLKQNRAFRQAAIIERLALQPGPVSLPELRKSLPCTKQAIDSLVEEGVISIMEKHIRRDPFSSYMISRSPVPTLTVSQIAALDIFDKTLNSDKATGKTSVFLLSGVTGSGKTEVYIRALQKTISSGKKGICLVPEISLTPQTIERFIERFHDRVAIFHSSLSLGQQFDEWHRINNGECDVVIGTRSALFTPLADLGLIIIDEEHEWTYKQVEKSPHYHARTAAIKLAELTGASVILGSATPDIESFYKAENNAYQLIELKERITPRGISPLPDVEVVDMRAELKQGNYGLFSRSLVEKMSKVFERNQQVILFLNRRGSANFVECQKCGYVPTCPRCLLSLIYHSDEGRLVCHHCNYAIKPPKTCPRCFSLRLKYLGVGTQKVEEETKRLFPKIRTLRWDRDVTEKPNAHQEILEKFKSQKSDVLIGTQMIAKGLDLPNVTVAGVINADIGLNLPDYKAGERSFQLICQIAGRAGRGLVPGSVVIQTFCPEHYVIKAASKQDYKGFYDQEIQFRQQMGYPPFNQLARLSYTSINQLSCQKEVRRIYELLKVEKDRKGLFNLRFIGPAPEFLPRVRGRFRWQIILCGLQLPQFLKEIDFPRGWMIDIDPVSVI
jgi:primosomal protein N' (replication factor Y) (superfamily II helicase)